MKSPSLLIIGAGASGLLAALSAARKHTGDVLVLERMSKPGIKLTRTGGGRGNLSHQATEEEFAGRFGRMGRFTIPAYRSLPPKALCGLLQDIGIPTRHDSQGRIYPASQSAVQVRDALVAACRQAGVRFEFNHPVKQLLPPSSPDEGWMVDSIRTRSVLLAAGGQSAAALGSNGSGFALAKSLGYRLVPPVPALTALHIQEPWVASHSGLTLPSVSLTLSGGGGKPSRFQGEMLFTHRGISGPAVLNLSGEVARQRANGKSVHLQLGLSPDKPDWNSLRKTAGPRPLHSWLSERFPRALAATLLHLAGIPPEQTFSRLTAAQGEELARLLTALPLTVIRTGGFEESMVTSGGIALKEINPVTLEGRLTPRLYFAGEVLDLNGPTGGWNLQWAFCSGHLAGTASASIPE
jgi:predicted Rossmann fold flavoprotein